MSSASVTRSAPANSAGSAASQQAAVLIMAAGEGSRLWPLSVQGRAKQFVALLQPGETMLQTTLRRALLVTTPPHVFVTVAPGSEALVFGQCPQIPRANVLVLPAGCDTLPGVAFASAVVEARQPGRVLVLMAADNFVGDEQGFAVSCASMVQAAASDGHLVSLGISPTYPSDTYGYMRMGKPCPLAPAAHWGLSYVEKPPKAIAAELVAAGEHLWNSGIFAWRPDNFFAALSRVDPSLVPALDAMRVAACRQDLAGLRWAVSRLPNLSLDHGLMEKLTAPNEAPDACHIFIAGNFAWDDVGSYAALKSHLPSDDAGNAVRGGVQAIDCAGCLIINMGTRLLRVQGLRDHVVVLGPQRELLVATLAAVGALRSRGGLALHSGTAAIGQACCSWAPDALGNTSDSPVVFAGARDCVVTGGQGFEVALLGSDGAYVTLSSEQVLVQLRSSQAGRLATGPEALQPRTNTRLRAPPATPSPLTLLHDASDLADAVARQLVADLGEALQRVLRPAVVFSAGATPTEVYRLLTTRYAQALPWPRVRLLQMDAYAGLAADDPAHFHFMLQQQLVAPLGMSARWLTGAESSEEMRGYAQDIAHAGGIDVVLHGIGRNGHLGFNEPGAAFDAPSGRVALATDTQADFLRAHPSAAVVPTHGVTLGLGLLNAARRVRVMAVGPSKQQALVAGLTAAPTQQCPVSSLQAHPDVRFFADRAAWLAQW